MGFLSDMFGGGDTTVDNSGALAQYANQMRGRMGVYDPWISAGGQARDRLSGEYGKSLDNPNWLQDSITKGFYESPYQKYMQDMVTKRMNYNATNTGMLGSGAANRALQQELTNMTGGYLNDYINRGMGTYGQALSGEQGMAGMGYQALGDQTNLYEQAAAGDLQGQMSKNAYDASQKANSGNMFGNILGTVGGAFANGMFGGSKGIGSTISNWFSPSSSNSGGGGGGYMTGAYNIPGVSNFNVGNFSY